MIFYNKMLDKKMQYLENDHQVKDWQEKVIFPSKIWSIEGPFL